MSHNNKPKAKRFNLETHHTHSNKHVNEWLDTEHERWLKEQEEAYYNRLQTGYDKNISDHIGMDANIDSLIIAVIQEMHGKSIVADNDICKIMSENYLDLLL